MTTNDSAHSAIPSRYRNPFATCWTRPGVLPFVFPDGYNAERLVEQLAANGWRGAIVGPHGSGKTTLLAALAPLLRSADHPVHVSDGYDQLGRIARWRLRRSCRRAGIGLLVTSHEPGSLPTLITLNPGAALLLRLVEKLCASASSHIGPVNGWPATADERLAEAPPIVDPVRSLPWWAPTPGAVAACHARRGGNVREMLFDLYDRHERLCWELRSVGDTLAIEPIPA